MSLTVGQLARRTGLTVRALHHYHAIGLLVPSHRSGGGYRLYSEADIIRLYRIQALRRLGLALADIGAVLAQQGASLPDIVAQQINELDTRIERAATLRTRLTHLRDVLANGGEPGEADWLGAVELITQYDQYCSPEELDRLLANMRTNIDAWPALIADVRAAMAACVPPESKEGQGLGRRWAQLVMNKVGGDKTLAIKMKLAYAEQPELQARIQTQSGLDPAMVDYMWQIWKHRQFAQWAPHLGAADARRLNLHDDTMRGWLRAVAAMHDAMKRGEPPAGEAVQTILVEWESLLEAFAAGDRALRMRMVRALETDAQLQQDWALDAELQRFVNRARQCAAERGVTLA